MAAFDTEDPKTNDPSYLGVSQGTEKAGTASIPQPRDLTIPVVPRRQENTAVGDLFKNFGKVAGEAINATDDVIKLSAEKTLYDGIDKIRDQFGVGDAAKISADGPPPTSVLGVEDAPVPPALGKVGNQVQGLYDAYSQGKLSNSYYYAKLEAFVRQTREQYPGYRDYIDQQVSRITGVTPANALRTALLQDTQELYKKLNSQADKQKAWELKEAGTLQAVLPEYIERNILKTSDKPAYTIPQMQAAVAAWDAHKQITQAGHADLELEAAEGKRYHEKAVPLATTEATTIVQKAIADSVTTVGNGTLGDLFQKISKANQTGTSPSGDEQGVMLGQINTFKLQMQHTVDQVLAQPAYRLMTPAEKEAVRKEAMTPVHNIEQALTNKDTGVFMMTAATIESQKNAEIKRLYGSSPVWGQINAIHGALGNDGLAFMFMTPGTQLLPAAQKGIAAYMTGKAALPGNSEVVSDAVRDLTKNGVKDGNVYNAVISNPLALIQYEKTNPEAIVPLVNYMFGPRSDLLELVNPAPTKGPSRSQVFESMISPKFSEKMKELDVSHPGVWKTYSSWAERNFMVMFKQNADDLSQLAENNHYYAAPKYDPKTNEVYLQNRNNVSVNSGKVDNLNAALRSIGNVYKQDGKDLAQEVPKLLNTMGVSNIQVQPRVATEPPKSVIVDTAKKVGNAVVDTFLQNNLTPEEKQRALYGRPVQTESFKP